MTSRPHGEPPVTYPLASAPQAWAAGALPLAVWSLLGLVPDAIDQRLSIRRPILPASIDWFELNRLRVGSATVDLRFAHHHERVALEDVTVRTGHLEVDVDASA